MKNQNGNSFILGVSGAGKSFTAKEEITNIILTDPNADIIIIDPEREYSPLVKAMQGEVIHISATSENHINAMDMNSDYGDGANPVILKSEFILSLCEQLIGGTNLGAKQKSIIDRCTASVYRYGYLEALKQYQKQKYDLFLLDINLPDGNGLEFCEKIRETSETPVLFLTANDTEEDMLEGFGVGCDDYISKPFSIEVLRKKVLAVLKRSGVGKFRMKYRDLELDKEKCLVLMKGQEIHLTSTEYKLLLYLMENRGRVVTKAMLLEQLWDIDGNFVDDNTVRVNIKRLRQKLNDEKQEYIVTVFGMGYSFGE